MKVGFIITRGYPHILMSPENESDEITVSEMIALAATERNDKISITYNPNTGLAVLRIEAGIISISKRF